MTDLVQDELHRPIVFVCHSLGGIVIKQVGFSFARLPKIFLTTAIGSRCCGDR
jgi:hypothetical protein